MWAIVTISFFMMRWAPGSPFDEDRKLPPEVEANKWVSYGMGKELTSPIAGEIKREPNVVEGNEYTEGTKLMTITGPSGATEVIEMPIDGKLVSLPVEDGEKIAKDARVAVVPRSLWGQYITAISKYAQLDFGVTIDSDGQRTVIENLERGLPISAQLGGFSLILAILFGVSAGLYAGLRQNTLGDHVVMSASMVGISVPTIVSGPLLILAFVFGLQWFPYGGWETWQHKVLPIVCLGLVYTASFARLTRGGMLEVIHSDFIRTARAKGVSERKVVTRHALKGALLPTVTYLGPALARIVTGSIIVERVFNIPGLGDYFVTSALNRDYPMVMGVIVLYSFVLVIMNLVVDIAYTFLDPRVSYD